MFYRHKSLRSAMQRSLLFPLGVLIGAIVYYVAVGPPGSPGPRHAQSPRSDSSVATMIRSHGCWSGPAPSDMAGKIPGHVVATAADGQLRYSSRLVGPALEQIFNGVDHHLTVYAFCR